MGLQWNRLRRRWAHYLGNRRPAPEDDLASLHTALAKTEPEEALGMPDASVLEGENSETNAGGATGTNPLNPLLSVTSRFMPLTPFERIAQAVNPRQGAEDEKARVKEALDSIEVIAFVGPSGTGKSTRAIEVSKQYRIEYFIDDGLLIHGSRIVSGTSAKRAATRMESVRQAIFLDETRAENMRRALAENRPEKLMILGTSDAMIEKICGNLHLQLPEQTIRIEDIATEEERRLAKQTRLQAGRHTIPVPSMEIKHEFNGSFLEPFARLRRRLERDKQAPDPLNESEKTVVRPTFSSLGSYSISDEAIHSLTLLLLRKIPGLAEVLDFRLKKEPYGIVLHLEITLYYGYNAQEVMQAIQQRLIVKIEEYTSINVMSVAVKARRVVLRGREESRRGQVKHENV